ncbi:MAG: AIR synthase-related protein [Patescibacteria group bacterium]
MAERIMVRAKGTDARADGLLRTLKTLFPRTKLRSVALADAYTIDAALSSAELAWIARSLTNPVIEESSTRTLAPKAFSYCIEIGFLPGVTDNVGNTARETIEDVLGRKMKAEEGVYSSRLLFLSGALSEDAVGRMARELHNPLIERATVISAADVKRRGIPIVVPKVKLHAAGRADEVNLEVDDAKLMQIGKEGVANADGSRRGPLALSLKALKIIRDHFRRKGRNPTDIELESLAQTWSEHCKHTIFADPLDDVQEGIYRRYIKGATQKIRKQKGKKDFCISVFTDNSGGIAFDDKYLVTHKVETHNSPSALDPFGGAITGIVGVNRDALGFGLGAKPIANVYGFCVGDPAGKDTFFRDKALTQPLLPARRILEGVIKGINAGGNQSGIPTPLGFVAVDPRYRGKPLVFAGTVGFLPRKNKNKKLWEKKARAGDYIVMVGGRVGLDGIHGATFSSESLSSGSPATAVQIGDPITQKKLSDAIIREARDKELYTSITDNGAGGLSCSVAEMAKECGLPGQGGCIVELDKVPVKYPGLAPWQIWISESQERMTLAVPKQKWPQFKKLFESRGVEATHIGMFTKKPTCVVRFAGKVVMDMNMSFLHDGRPIESQKSTPVQRAYPEPAPKARSENVAKSLLELLSRPNIASTAFIAEQYDYEVQGTSVTKPLQGRGRVNADAGVLQPLPDSKRGIVLSQGYCPWYSDIDTYTMAAAAVDTAVRNAIAAGASRDYLAILDNFCWSTSNTPERLYELKRSAEALHDVAVAYGTPLISGKDSMFNDFRGFTATGEPIHIAAPPTLLVSALGVIPDVGRAVTLDLKNAGDFLYLIGETNDELGASEYFTMLSERPNNDGHRKSIIGAHVPMVNVRRSAKAYDAISKAIAKGLIASAFPVGRGGLGVVLAKTAIAGQLGIKANLSKLKGNAKQPDGILFSESQGRMILSVRPEHRRAFESLMRGVACTCIGEVTSKPVLAVVVGGKNIRVPVSALTKAYRKTFKNW